MAALPARYWQSRLLCARTRLAFVVALFVRVVLIYVWSGFCFGVFYFAVASGQPCAHFGRIVIEGSHSAAVCDLSVYIDDVESLGPSGVRVIRGIFHIIDAEGQRIFESFR